MGNMKEKSFDALVKHFLGKSLPQYLSGAVSLSNLSSEAQEYIMRLFGLMKRSGYSTVNFNPLLIQWISHIIPNMLPSAWGGRVPPITFPLRHKKFDDYVAGFQWNTRTESPTFIDIGCGFPPVTTAETAQRFPDWQIVGVDRSFADYVLYDKDGNYACFDPNGKFQYFQAMTGSDRQALYADSAKTKSMFEQLFSNLFPLLKDSNGPASKTVEKDGNRLIHNHIRDFETDSLLFIKSEALNLKLAPAKVYRIMNMLVYFKPEIRKQILYQVCELLEDDGIIITGTNGVSGQSRYSVYQKGGDGLFQKEFAFSLDNLGHLAIMPWFTIQENDPEAMLLAKYSGVIRSDQSFWPAFSNRLDKLLINHDICRREKNGYLHFPQQRTPIDKYVEKSTLIWQQMQKEGYADHAVDILVQTGFDAWKNSVGDIAVRPPTDF